MELQRDLLIGQGKESLRRQRLIPMVMTRTQGAITQSLGNEQFPDNNSLPDDNDSLPDNNSLQDNDSLSDNDSIPDNNSIADNDSLPDNNNDSLPVSIPSAMTQTQCSYSLQ